jgi:predicted permease
VRSREFAIRFAIGASQKRVVTQLLTESVLLALIGGCLGIAFANWATHAVLALVPATVPRADEVRLDAHVLIFTIAVSIVTGILFGLAPALKMLRPDLQGTLKGAERGSTGSHHRTQNAFVVFETALALVLLIAAGLMLRTMRALWTSDPGFDPSHVLTLSFTLSAAKTSNAAQLRESQRELLGRYESLPEVESAAIIGGSLPMSGDSELPFWLVGQPKPASDSQMNWALFYGVSPKYWNAMRIPLLRGRVFTDQDNERSPNVLVVDEEFARRVFPNQDPIGKRINLGLFETQPEIIGVVGHVNHWGLGNTAHENLKSELYLPVDQFPDKFAPLIARGLSIVVRTRTNPELLADPVRRITSQFDSQAVVYDFASMEHIVSNSVASQRFAMTLLGIFAALALVLASVGIYGVLSYLVGQRTQEVGIRMALGAQRGDVLRLILGQGTKMALIGVAIGMVVALVLTRLMGSMLYGVSATDPLTYLTVAAMLVIVATLACGVPAWRASNVDPMVALRYE